MTDVTLEVQQHSGVDSLLLEILDETPSTPELRAEVDGARETFVFRTYQALQSEPDTEKKRGFLFFSFFFRSFCLPHPISHLFECSSFPLSSKMDKDGEGIQSFAGHNQEPCVV